MNAINEEKVGDADFCPASSASAYPAAHIPLDEMHARADIRCVPPSRPTTCATAIARGGINAIGGTNKRGYQNTARDLRDLHEQGKGVEHGDDANHDERIAPRPIDQLQQLAAASARAREIPRGQSLETSSSLERPHDVRGEERSVDCEQDVSELVEIVTA
jgi:hypothetical protein